MDIHVLTRILQCKILAVYLALRHVRVALFFTKLLESQRIFPWIFYSLLYAMSVWHFLWLPCAADSGEKLFLGERCPDRAAMGAVRVF